MILAPRFDPKFPVQIRATPVQEPRIGGTSRPPNRVRLFTT
jgi:hypothetical protein